MLSEKALKPGSRLPELRHKLTATDIVLGATASRDWRPMHHDRAFAIDRNGVKDIFLNSPTQAAWIERYITDCCGAASRLGKLSLKLKRSIFPQDDMLIEGNVVGATSAPDSAFVWIDLALTISVEGEIATACDAKVAVPNGSNNSPWRCEKQNWNQA